MTTKIIEKDGNKFLMVSVHPNMVEGFISKSGKSWVFRVMGSYLKSNGEVIGMEGRVSGYISRPFKFEVAPMKKGVFVQSHVIKYNFGGMIHYAVKVHIDSIKY